LLQIQSEAYRKEQELKGKADAAATEIYAKAYNSSPSAADFYLFVKTLETYKETLSKDTTAVFTTNSDLFRLLKQVETPKTTTSPAATPPAP
jgi:membrane protease subunit HflC